MKIATFLYSLAFFLLLSPVVIYGSDCERDKIQPLWSKEKQEQMGIFRQREIYKKYPTNRRRISNQAGERGFCLLKEMRIGEAASEFNRSWRFDPDNYYAYYGFGVICYEYASQCENDYRIKYLTDSISLLQKAQKLIPKEREDDLKNDLALSILALAKIEVQRDRTLGENLFSKVNRILEEILSKEPENGCFWFTKAIYHYYRADYNVAYKSLKKAKEFGYDGDPKLEEDLKRELNI